MENKTKILIGLGLAVATGIGIYLLNKKNKEKKTIAEKSGKLDVKSVIPKLDVKVPVAVKAISIEKKVGFVGRSPSVAVEPVILTPDRHWLERNWDYVN